MNTIIFCFFLGFFSASNVLAVPTVEEYANSKQWLRLIHYKDNWYKIGPHSRIDRKEYFLSPKGKANPLKELEATISAFKSPDVPKAFKWHPQCAFPARKMVLERDLGLTFPKQKCEDYDWWRGRIQAKNISLVFSSYYAGNPASMFGHTLLKLNRAAEGPGKLSDFSLNFAANTFGEGGALFMIKGLFGGYPGFFSTDPYYVKVNEYAQGESRDVWEYELALSESEMDLIMAHIWELKTNAYLDYFFFDENCSYMLLEVLEVAKLDWSLSHGFFFYAMPIDTVRRLKDVNGIRAVHYRASYQRKMEARVNNLDKTKLELFRKLVEGDVGYEAVEDREVLEAYSAYLHYKRFDQSEDKDAVTAYKKKISKVLIKRARLKGKVAFDINQVTEKFKEFDPLEAHLPYAVSLRHGYNERYRQFTQFKFRFALADLYNNDFGYPDFFELQGPYLSALYREDKKRVELQEVNVVSMLSLVPYKWYSPKFSWGVKIKAEQGIDFDSDNSLVNKAQGFFGINGRILSEKLSLFALSTIEAQVARSLPKKGYRILPGLRLGTIWRFSHSFRWVLDTQAQYDVLDIFNERWRLYGETGFSFSLNRNNEIHLKQKLLNLARSGEAFGESSLKLVHFF